MKGWSSLGGPLSPVLLGLFALFLGDTQGSNPDSPLVELSVKEFEAIQSSNEIWLVDFYDPNCQPCKQLRPEVEAAALDLKGLGVNVGALDVSSKKAQKLAFAANIKTLPSIKMYVSEPTPNPYTGKSHREAVDMVMKDGLKARHFKKFATDNIPNLVNRTGTEGLEDLVSMELQNGSVAVVFTERESTAPLLKTLALKLKGRLSMVEVPSSESQVLEKFGVESMPSLVVLPSSKVSAPFSLDTFDPEQAVTFEGDIKNFDQLLTFLSRHAAKEDPNATNKQKFNPAAARSLGLEKQNFKDLLLGSEDPWVVWYMEDEDESPEEPVWVSFLQKAEGVVFAATVYCKEQPDLCAAEASPAEGHYKFYASGLTGQEKSDEAKVFKTATEAFEEAIASIPDLVYRGEDSNVEKLIGDVATMGKTPLVVFSRKEEPALFVKGLAYKWASYIGVIQVTNPSRQLRGKFGDILVPGMFVLIPGDPVPGMPQAQLRIAAYSPHIFGPFKFSSVASFVVQAIGQVNKEVPQAMVARLQVKPPSNSTQDGSANQLDDGSGRPLQPITQHTWLDICSPSSSRLCAIAFLVGEEKLDVVQRLAAAEMSSPVNFMHIDGSCYEDFANSFDLQLPKLPTMVVYSPKKDRFASFLGTFNEDNLKDFFRGVMSGRIPTAPVLSKPVITEDLTCLGVDSDAVEAEPVEEEDIGDLMAEILAEEKQKKKELEAQLKKELEEAKRLAEEAKKSAEEGSKKKKKKKSTKKAPAEDEL